VTGLRIRVASRILSWGPMMREGSESFDDRFRPLRPVSRPRLLAAFILGPVAWVIALTVGALVLEHTDAIELGAVVTFVSLVVSAIVLSLLRLGRLREERRYEHRT
jgi:hypothetical protein